MVDFYNKVHGGEKTNEPMDGEEFTDISNLLDSVPLTMRMN